MKHQPESFGLHIVKRYFATYLMKKRRKPYTIFQKASSIFLMLTLTWLTVSTPFIIKTQQELAKQQKSVTVEIPMSDAEDDTTDSSNNIEEKVPNSANSLAEEFLHEHHSTQDYVAKTSRNYNLENASTYIAFHGELHAPPPNAA
jgi:hypothetical protein